MEEKQIQEQEKMLNKETLLAKVIDRLNTILDKYMSRYPRYHEFKEFMKDGKNLYDEDHSIKPEYQEWIDDVEKFSANNPIEDTLEEVHKDDPFWKDIYEGIEAYVMKNAELTLSYEKAQMEEGETFDCEEWIYNQIRKSSKDDKEADEKLSALAEMISTETLDTLDDGSELRKYLKEKINRYE